VFALVKLTAQGEAVAVGQTEVEHDEMVGVDRTGPSCTGQRAFEVDGVAVLGQPSLHHSSQGDVVLDHQHPHGRSSFHIGREAFVKPA
jgi:hypothetical protein